jgi:hypothetical protein
MCAQSINGPLPRLSLNGGAIKVYWTASRTAIPAVLVWISDPALCRFSFLT